jgi:hypothetical protein
MQGQRDVWERWMARDHELAPGQTPLHAMWTFSDQALAYAMDGDTRRAVERLAEARARAPNPTGYYRSLSTAAPVVAWRARRADLLGPVPPFATPTARMLYEGTAASIAGDDARAIALLERALAEATETRTLVPTAWLLAAIAGDRDPAAKRIACGYIERPRMAFTSWAYARPICAATPDRPNTPR